ncbi:hypothetical protein ORV05_05020 [Amycolatopsis cynarae]|uniref:Ig-like domain-containing protein n=1 Tax=Amycolatopsis cynarae TaxID=2995223 RepID=A0ABY7B5E5_9PSEU|nr:choice-of-anchor R domain-containing protein [Amycolatopsis sp. HUAS 11-8]WAL67154.1 hypothetical protein ORV05_05020 [Amycolatopsis sp. HUAS 11-8]
MATPTWLAATAGQPTKAGQINQFLGTHSVQFLYSATQTVAQATAGTGGVNTNGLYIAQSFTTPSNQTQIGWIGINATVTGTPAPLTVTVQTNNAGAPSGTVLATTLIPAEFLTGTPGNIPIPLPCTVTASTTYWVVAQAVGDASNYFTWYKSNQTSGASTSANGTTWSAQTYGLLYNVHDQSSVPPLLFTYEDNGARWTEWVFHTNGQFYILAEFTQGQTPTGYTTSLRTLNYTNGLLTSIT